MRRHFVQTHKGAESTPRNGLPTIKLRGGETMNDFSKTPQTQSEDYPQKASRPWHRILRNKNVRLKNYLYFLLYKSLLQQSWSILEWKLAEEGSRLLRNQLPDLYVLITIQLLEIKNKGDDWNGANYYFTQIPHWIPRSVVRAAYGIGRGESLNDLISVQEELRALSQALLGNDLIFELGVTEDRRIVHHPQRKRGYHDHGSCVPAHKRGRNISLPGEPEPDSYQIGDDPVEDVGILEILSKTELFHFRNRP